MFECQTVACSTLTHGHQRPTAVPLTEHAYTPLGHLGAAGRRCNDGQLTATGLLCYAVDVLAGMAAVIAG